MGAVLASYDTAMLEVRRLLRGESEALRIGYLPSAARDYLNEALARLRQAQPKTKLKLLDLSPGEQIAALRAGEIDVGLTEASDLLAREFYTRKLAEVTSCVVLPADHPLAGESRISIRQLKNEAFVIGTEEEVPGTTRRIASYCRHYGKFRPRAILRATTLAHALEIIANENAVAIAPAYMRHIAAPGVVVIPLIEPELKWELWVVWQRGKTGGALRALLDALGGK
jgi:DNA-binding transcriptional LysR family regulator